MSVVTGLVRLTEGLKTEYSSLAKFSAEQELEKLKQYIESNPSHSSQEIERVLHAENEQFVYTGYAKFISFLYLRLEIEIVKFGGGTEDTKLACFNGDAGGLVLGTGISAGTLWLNFPIEELLSQDARFQANFLPTMTNVNFWKMDGTPIGSFVGINVAAISGIVGGQGTFVHP